MMQRNAVIIERARGSSVKSAILTQKDTQASSESVDETMQRINREEKKFQNFWVGVTSLVESYRYHIRKPEREPGQFIHAEQQETLRSTLVWDPNSRLRIIWDVLLGIFLIYSVSMIPYRVGFDLRSSGREEDFDNFITSMFALDILVQMNSAYLDTATDKLVFDRHKIIKHYCSYWFWVDLLSTIPFDGITDRLEGHGVGASHPGAVRLIRALRLVRYFKLVRYTQQNQQLEKLRIDPTLVSLILLMIQIFFIAHIFACFWHYISLEQYVGVMNTTWIDTFGYTNRSVGARYVASLYYVVVTMLTIGYGDIYATNDVERFYAVVTMITGGVVFGALVAKVAAVLDKRNPQERAYNKKMYELKLFLVDVGVTMEIRDKAKLAYSFYLQKKSSFKEAGIFESLPPYILSELVFRLYESDISKISLFRTLDPSFVVHIVIHCRPCQAQAGDVIYYEGDICNDIIFLKEGHIRIYTHDGQKQIMTGYVSEGDMFGDAELFVNATALATYKAIRYSQMLIVNHKVIQDAMEDHYLTSQKLESTLRQRYTNLMAAIRSKSDLQKLEVLIAESSGGMMSGGSSGTNSVDGDGNPATSIPPRKGLGLNLNGLNGPVMKMIRKRQQQARLQREREEQEKAIWAQRELLVNSASNSASISNSASTHSLQHGISLNSAMRDDSSGMISTTTMESANTTASSILLPSTPSSTSTGKTLTSSKKRALVAVHKIVYHNGELEDLSNGVDNNIDLMDENFDDTKKIIRVLDTKTQKNTPIVKEVDISRLYEKRLLHPQGYWKLSWDFFIALLILYSVLVIPVEIAFQEQAYRNSNTVNLYISLMFAIDIVISFRTCYESKHYDALVISNRLIAYNYIQFWFWIDLFSTIPFDDAVSIFTNGDNSNALQLTQVLKVVRLFRLARVLRIFKLGIYLEKLEDITGVSPVFFELLALMMQVFFIVHIACCIWWGATAAVTPDGGTVWFLNGDGDPTIDMDAPIARKYLLSVYFTFTTMSTVGYGDIHPQAVSAQQILCSFMVIIGASTFGYMIANVSTVMNSFSGNGNTSKAERLAEIHDYLHEKDCPPDLTHKVLNHFERQFLEQASAFNVDEITSCLPPLLRTTILGVVYEKKMKKIPIFKHIQNQSVAIYIFRLLIPSYYEEDRYIIKEGETADEIFFLVAGHARAFKTDSLYLLKQSRTEEAAKAKKRMAKNKNAGILPVVRGNRPSIFGGPTTVNGGGEQQPLRGSLARKCTCDLDKEETKEESVTTEGVTTESATSISTQQEEKVEEKPIDPSIIMIENLQADIASSERKPLPRPPLKKTLSKRDVQHVHDIINSPGGSKHNQSFNSLASRSSSLNGPIGFLGSLSHSADSSRSSSPSITPTINSRGLASESIAEEMDEDDHDSIDEEGVNETRVHRRGIGEDAINEEEKDDHSKDLVEEAELDFGRTYQRESSMFGNFNGNDTTEMGHNPVKHSDHSNHNKPPQPRSILNRSSTMSEKRVRFTMTSDTDQKSSTTPSQSNSEEAQTKNGFQWPSALKKLGRKKKYAKVPGEEGPDNNSSDLSDNSSNASGSATPPTSNTTNGSVLGRSSGMNAFKARFGSRPKPERKQSSNKALLFDEFVVQSESSASSTTPSIDAELMIDATNYDEQDPTNNANGKSNSKPFPKPLTQGMRESQSPPSGVNGSGSHSRSGESSIASSLSHSQSPSNSHDSNDPLHIKAELQLSIDPEASCESFDVDNSGNGSSCHDEQCDTSHSSKGSSHSGFGKFFRPPKSPKIVNDLVGAIGRSFGIASIDPDGSDDGDVEMGEVDDDSPESSGKPSTDPSECPEHGFANHHSASRRSMRESVRIFTKRVIKAVKRSSHINGHDADDERFFNGDNREGLQHGFSIHRRGTGGDDGSSDSDFGEFYDDDDDDEYFGQGNSSIRRFFSVSRMFSTMNGRQGRRNSRLNATSTEDDHGLQFLYRYLGGGTGESKGGIAPNKRTISRKNRKSRNCRVLEATGVSNILSKSFSKLTSREFASAGFILIGDVNPGDFVGHIAFMSNAPHDASVRTITQSTVYSLSKTDISKLVRTEPSVGIQLQSALARAVIAQGQEVGRFHMKKQRATFMKDIKKEYYVQYKKKFRHVMQHNRALEERQEQHGHHGHHHRRHSHEGELEGVVDESKDDETGQHTHGHKHGRRHSHTPDQSQTLSQSVNTIPGEEEVVKDGETIDPNEPTIEELKERPSPQRHQSFGRLRAVLKHIDTKKKRQNLEKVLSKEHMMYDSSDSENTSASDDTDNSFNLHRTNATMNVDNLINIPRTCSMSEIVPQHMSSIGSIVELSTVSSRTVKSIRLAKQGISRRLRSRGDNDVGIGQRGEIFGRGRNNVIGSDGENGINGPLNRGNTTGTMDARYELYDSMTRASNMVRRQSFPSLDNDLWRQRHIHQGVV